MTFTGPMKINTRKISRWRWEISCRYWQMRRSLLNWIFHYLNLVRCHLVTEQRLKEPPEPDAVVRALGGGRYARYSLHQGHRELATLVEYDVDFPWIFVIALLPPRSRQCGLSSRGSRKRHRYGKRHRQWGLQRDIECGVAR